MVALKPSKLLQNVPKRENSPKNVRAKVTVRANVMQVLGAEGTHVLDAYAGDGMMFKEIWNQAASYVGCDQEPPPDDDERLLYRVDNLRLLRAIPLEPYNLFDMDAYGSPWDAIYILCNRRRVMPGEKLGVCITDGQGMKMKMGGMSLGLSLMAGMRNHMPGMGSQQHEAMDRAIIGMGRLLNAKLIHRWQAVGEVGSSIFYLGLVFQA